MMPCARFGSVPGRTRRHEFYEVHGEAEAERMIRLMIWRSAGRLKQPDFDRAEGALDVELGFICGSGVEPCRFCGIVADKLCDAPVGNGKTCDIALCEKCATNIGPETDLCPTHVILMKGSK